MLLALPCAVLSAIGMMLGLLRWPTIHWRLAEVFVAADPAQQAVLGAIFDGLKPHDGCGPRRRRQQLLAPPRDDRPGRHPGPVSGAILIEFSAWSER
jgi:hypothetical protein